MHVTSGKAAGRRLHVTCAVGDLLLCSSYGEHNVVRFRGVTAGDDVHVSNRDFLAYCYFPRHHVHDSVNYDSLRVDGHPMFAQHPSPPGPPLSATPWTGRYQGKLLWVHFTHDSAVWPPQAFLYRDVVQRAQAERDVAERYRLRWVRHAEHVPVAVVPDAPGIRASNTRLIDYQPVLEQSLADLVAWVEDGIAPPVEQYRYDQDGRVAFPESAAERAGIQPVVTVTANGAARAEVRTGEEVTLQVRAEVAPGAGSVVDVQWDVDGSGDFPYRDDLDRERERREAGAHPRLHDAGDLLRERARALTPRRRRTRDESPDPGLRLRAAWSCPDATGWSSSTAVSRFRARPPGRCSRRCRRC